jgi:L-ascorbate metabolism protein UlaG (beta-lactamase superfamily)
MTDGFFSRPSLATTLLGHLRPDAGRIEQALADAGVERLDAVIPVHTHYDHAMDSGSVAQRTGAALIGGTSASFIGQGAGLPAERIVVATAGETITTGTFELTLLPGQHCPPDRFPGQITEPVVPPARVTAYRCGDAWAIILRHRPTGRSMLINGSAGCVPGALAGQSADIAYLGIAQLGVLSSAYVQTYWTETVRAVGARRVVFVHWDDFFRPLTEPLRALPYAGDDLDVTMRLLSDLAREDGVSLHFPTVWRRENPWA